MSLDDVKSAEVAVLVVDDRSEDLLAVGSILDDPFYELVKATSGREALKRVLDRDFAVILLDVNLPDMDGFELAAMIKQRERSRLTPIIFLTAMQADVGILYRGYSVGAVDYLTKPIDADVLRAKVSIFAELHRKDLRIKQQAEALIEADRRARERQVADILKASEKRYRDLAEAIPPIVFTAAPDGEVRYFNRRWYDYTGQSREQAEGWRWTTALHPEDQRSREETWRQALVSGGELAAECRIRGKDGAYRWHQLQAVAERGPGGEIIGWLGTYTDYDELRRAHAQAEASRQRLEILAEAGAALSSTLDDRENLDRVADLVKPRMCDWCVLELKAEEHGHEDVGGFTVVRANPEVDAGLARLRDDRPPGSLAGGALCEVLATGRPELIRVTTDDVLRALAQDEQHARLLSELGLESVMSVPITARGRVLGAMTLVSSSARHYDDADLAMAVDLGHRIGVTIDGARLFREAQNAVALRDEFLSIASHELRTPLTSLLLQQQTLARQMNAAPAPQREKLDKAVKQTRRLEKLIDHLLDVSRVITGRLALEREDVDLAETVRDVAERFSEEAQRAGCRIDLGIGDPLVGNWDRLRLEQVFTNLISNACRYAAGAPIEVKVSRENGLARVEVIDHGPGIEPDHLGRIFGRFERGASSSQHGGLGLGLYITRHVVEAHGGTIAVASKPGDGAHFTVELPFD